MSRLAFAAPLPSLNPEVRGIQPTGLIQALQPLPSGMFAGPVLAMSQLAVPGDPFRRRISKNSEPARAKSPPRL